MKKTLIIMLMLIVALMTAPSCISQAKVFKEVASMPDVTSVYIGPAMLRLAGGAASVGGYGEYSQYISDLKSIEVISCEKASSIEKVSAACDRMLAQMHYEILLEANEEDEHAIIYGGIPDGENPDILDDIVIVSREKGEFSLVYIRGKINVGEMVKEISPEPGTGDETDK
ncbi:MAG: DUF4252 domain-containing protein [Bacteroidales bacterium]|nr:DUF4252 domain-containing protein [Bacteroidales bacterium]